MLKFPGYADPTKTPTDTLVKAQCGKMIPLSEMGTKRGLPIHSRKCPECLELQRQARLAPVEPLVISVKPQPPPGTFGALWLSLPLAGPLNAGLVVNDINDPRLVLPRVITQEQALGLMALGKKRKSYRMRATKRARAFNAAFLVGTLVNYHSAIGGPGTGQFKVASTAWVTGSGETVCRLEGKSAYVAVEAVSAVEKETTHATT